MMCIFSSSCSKFLSIVSEKIENCCFWNVKVNFKGKKLRFNMSKGDNTNTEKKQGTDQYRVLLNKARQQEQGKSLGHLNLKGYGEGKGK